jgi:hypothetical protein
MNIGESVDYLFLVDEFLSIDLGVVPDRQERTVYTYFKDEIDECNEMSVYDLYLFYFYKRIRRR